MNQKKEAQKIEKLVKRIDKVVKEMNKKTRKQKDINLKTYLKTIEDIMSKIKEVSK